MTARSVDVDEVRRRADAALDALGSVLTGAAGLPAPTALAVLVDLVRAASELRLRSERAIGALLAAHPDPGGRPSPCRPTPVGRQLRQALDLNRTCCHWLVRLATDVDDAAFERIVDELWAGYPSAARLAARHVVLGLRDGDEGKPPPSVGSE